MRQEWHYVLNEQILSPTDPLVEVWRAKGHKLVNIWCREPVELPCESPGLPVPQHENRGIREERVCSITNLPFGAEGWRHCVAAISNFVGGTVLPPSHPAISQAQAVLAPTCKAVHTWYYITYDEELALSDDVTSHSPRENREHTDPEVCQSVTEAIAKRGG